MRKIVLAVAACLILASCSTGGPLPGDRWFLDYRSKDGPVVWAGATLANIVLAASYATFGAIVILGRSHADRAECERAWETGTHVPTHCP